MNKRLKRQRLELKRQQNVQNVWQELYTISNSLTPQKIREDESILEQHYKGLKKRLQKMKIARHKSLTVYRQYANFILNHRQHTEYGLLQLRTISASKLR